MRSNNALIYISLALGLISLIFAIRQLAGWILPPLILLAVLVAGLYFVTKIHKEVLLELYVLPYGKQFVSRWCNLLGEQVPFRDSPDEVQGFRLSNEVQRQEAIDYCARYCRGYEESALRIINHLFEQLILREQRSQVLSSHPPLGAYLLVGPEGSGKSYFLRIMAKAITAHGEAIVIDSGQWQADACNALLGNNGLLVQSVKRNPYSFFVFEVCESMHELLCKALVALIRQGQLIDDRGRPISFNNCVFFFTTTRLSDMLVESQAGCSSRNEARNKATEYLSEEGGFDNDFLSRLTDVFVTAPLNALQQAEVVALQFIKECAAHGVQLQFLDAEVLASQVIMLKQEKGFAQLQDRVRDFLRQPLVLAATQHSSKISITLEPVK